MKVRFTIPLLIFLLLLACFLPLSLARLVARDEGYYLMAAKLVMHGRIPYLDFFYPQAPFLPYIFGSVMAIFGYNFEVARVLCAVITAGIGCLLYAYCEKELGRCQGLLAVLIFTCSGLVFSWFCTARTYAPATLATMLAMLLLQYNSRRTGLWAGVCLGLAFGMRSYFVLLLPIFLWQAWRQNLQQAKALFIGSCLSSIPILLLLASGPEQFWFNNLGYHLLRSNADAEAVTAKLKILNILLGLESNEQMAPFQYSFLFLLSLAETVLRISKHKWPSLPAQLALALFGISFLPNPSYLQYFSVTVPFLIISACGFFNAAAIHFKKWPVFLAILLLTSYYATFLPREIKRYTITGDGVSGIGDSRDPADWSLSNIRKIGKIIDSHVPPNQPVLVIWPGHLVGSHAWPWPGFENHFGLGAATKLSPDKRQLFRVCSKQEMHEIITSGRPELILFYDRTRKRSFGQSLARGGYKLVKKLGTVEFFARET